MPKKEAKKEVELEFLEGKDWDRMHQDVLLIKADIDSIQTFLVRAGTSISTYIDSVKKGEIVTTKQDMKGDPRALRSAVTQRKINAEYVARRKALNELSDYLSKVPSKASDVKKRLTDFKKWNNILQGHALRVLGILKDIRERKYGPYEPYTTYGEKEVEKLHEFLTKDEQYAIQLGRNLNLFVEKLLVRVEFITRVVSTIPSTVQGSTGPNIYLLPKLKDRMSGIESMADNLGLPTSFQLGYEELIEVYGYVNEIKQRVDFYELKVMTPLKVSISEALKKTGAYT